MIEPMASSGNEVKTHLTTSQRLTERSSTLCGVAEPVHLSTLIGQTTCLDCVRAHEIELEQKLNAINQNEATND